jgi:hypothetical protein
MGGRDTWLLTAQNWKDVLLGLSFQMSIPWVQCKDVSNLTYRRHSLLVLSMHALLACHLLHTHFPQNIHEYATEYKCCHTKQNLKQHLNKTKNLVITHWEG